MTSVELSQPPQDITITTELEQEVIPPVEPETSTPRNPRIKTHILTTLIIVLLFLGLCWLICKPF